MNFQKAKIINKEKVEIKAKKDKLVLKDYVCESLTDCACGQPE